MLSKTCLFDPATIDLRLRSPDQRDIRTISELVEYNALHNPDHVFCIQARRHQESISVSCFQLKQAIVQCSDWLIAYVKELELPQEDEDGVLRKGRPVALAMDSDIGLLVHLLSFLSLGVPVLLLSARLSPTAIQHLVLETSVGAIIAAPNHQRKVQEILPAFPFDKGKPTLYRHEPFETFLDDDIADLQANTCRPYHYLADTDRNVIILHSSGTTGMPKPIYCSHRYLLCFATCHDFEDPLHAQAPNVSTLPLFHGFGLVAPFLSLGVGMTLILPSSSSVPSGSSIVELIKREKAQSLMTVPSILEDVSSSEDPEGIEVLKNLNFVAFGGGPLKASVGHKLSAAKGRLLNHYGATEIGPIAPIFIPPADYDYHFFRMRKDLDLELAKLPADEEERSRYKLTALPFGWTSKMEVQDELISNPLYPETDFSAIGRKDAMILLATGEKVVPNTLETGLSEAAMIKAAIAFGDGQFELGVIVEPQNALNPEAREDFVSSIWPLVIEINKKMDGHAQISGKAAVVVTTLEKPLPRSDKGSVMRREAYKLFEEEISQAYRGLEVSAMAGLAPDLNIDQLDEDLKSMIQSSLGWKLEPDKWSVDDDLFQLGMDSLQAVKLRRLLLSSNIFTPDDHACRQRDFIYKHPTVSELASALRGTPTSIPEEQIRSFVDRYSIQAQPGRPNVILLTGSTGGLGANTLLQLSRSPRVLKVICVIRPIADKHAFVRQCQALRAQKISAENIPWDKVELIQANAAMPSLGLTEAQYARIQKGVTHIVHAAWPMDFKLKLPSFKAQFETLRNLLNLAIDSSRFSAERPRLLFVSSVATVGQYKSVYGNILIPEVPVTDERCTNAFGYGGAKLVCERMVGKARLTHGTKIDVSLVRVGQMTGSRATGYWNPREHIPALIKSSQYIGALPKIEGTLSWLPVDRAAEALHDLILQDMPSDLVYHLENPIRQTWHEALAAIAPPIHVDTKDSLPLNEWIARVQSADMTIQSENANPAQKLLEFFKEDFGRMASGEVKLDMTNCLKASPSLLVEERVSGKLLASYVDVWTKDGFLAE